MSFTAGQAALASAVVIAAGTGYSLYFSTWLDTSNPLITNIPHPLADTHWFASKQNPINTYFLKKLWFWTTAAWGALFFTSPPHGQTYERMYKYLAETSLWMVFTGWFFGPAVFERVISLTGGECSVTLPSGYVLNLPMEYCRAGHKHISPATHPSLFAASLLVPQTETWKAVPRLRKGHDVSGHIFLLTMSCLFLANQLAESRKFKGPRDPLHQYAIYGTMGVIAMEFFSMYITGVYFHSPFEKFTGFLLGLAGYIVTMHPFFDGATPVDEVQETKAQVTNAAAQLKETIEQKTK